MSASNNNNNQMDNNNSNNNSNNNNNNNNNINNNDEIAPDMPVMRSVLIRSAEPAMPRARSFHSDNSFAKQQYEAPLLKRAPEMMIQTSAPSKSSWQPTQIPQLPEYYPLERSHVSIGDVDCVEVANRIAECLRNESIAATFSENKAVAETLCHTQFFVQLFESKQEIIVEVQRRTGCSYKFRQCSKAVLRAVKGEPTMPAPRTFALPRSLPPMPASVNNEALEIAFDLLNQDRLDAQMLGMESLLGLSRTASFETEQLAIIVSLATSRQSELRRDALAILANCLASTTVPTSDHLLRTLIADLTDKDLHVAHQAARCLTAICQKSSHEVKALVLNMGSSVASQMAKMEGESHHALLEKEARLLQSELEGL